MQVFFVWVFVLVGGTSYLNLSTVVPFFVGKHGVVYNNTDRVQLKAKWMSLFDVLEYQALICIKCRHSQKENKRTATKTKKQTNIPKSLAGKQLKGFLICIWKEVSSVCETRERSSWLIGVIPTTASHWAYQMCPSWWLLLRPLPSSQNI